jgi:hypothetical protein
MALADLYEGLGDTASDYSSDDSASIPRPHPEVTRYVPAIQSPLSRDDFEYYWSEELVTLYHQLKDTCNGAGWCLFEQLDFCEFCKHAYQWSSRTKPPC